MPSHRFKNFCIHAFREGTWISKNTVFTAAIIGGSAHLGYYFLFKFVFALPYENLALRLIAASLCVFSAGYLIIKNWPIGRFFPLYWHGMLIFVLPFIFTVYLLKNNFHELWLYWEIFMIFILIIHVPNWFMFSIDFTLGVGAALIFFALTDSFQNLTPHFNVPLYSIVILFSIIAGLIFHASNKKLLQDTEEKVRLAMSSLAASIAHEMRNPLGQINHSLERITTLLPPPTTQATRASLSAIDTDLLYHHTAIGRLATQRGTQIISMILDEVKSTAIDTTQFILISAEQATRKAVAEYSYANVEEREQVRVEVLQDFIFQGDETRYIFILFNLLKNALYYCQQNPAAPITITIDYLTVRVKDSGPGIPSARLPHLFEAFQTLGKAGGTGLGLAYCKRSMQAFGGEIRCASVVGEYTEFTLHFPPIAQPELVPQSSHNLATPKRLTTQRILIADDDAMARQITIKTLQHHYPALLLEEAEHGPAVLQKCQAQAYDLLILDLRMPLLDGYQCAQQLRASVLPQVQSMPILAYTTELADFGQTKTEKVGINAFLSKLCSPFELLASVEQLCQTADHAPPEASADLRGKTILVADDQAYNRQIISQYLQAWGVCVLQAAHGQAALEQLKRHTQIDAILLDLQMPVLDGFETARAIRSQAWAYQQTPIIALTGYTDEASKQAGDAAGINDYLIKPIAANNLRQKLSQQFCQPPTVTAAGATATVAVAPATAQETATSVATTSPDLPLLNQAQLDEIETIGLLNALPDYVPEFIRLFKVLKQTVADNNFAEMRAALHAFLGFNAVAGALALHRYLWRLYDSVSHGKWPSEDNWLATVENLTNQTTQALQAYYVTRSSTLQAALPTSAAKRTESANNPVAGSTTLRSRLRLFSRWLLRR